MIIVTNVTVMTKEAFLFSHFTHPVVFNSFLLLTGPGLGWKRNDISNHSILKRDVIGTNDDAVYCVTDAVTHCETSHCLPESGGSRNGRGCWYFPSDGPGGIKVPFSSEQHGLWSASWLTAAVLLNYRGDGTNGSTGLFRCDIKDDENITHHFYTCIYDDGPSDFKCKVHTSVLACM